MGQSPPGESYNESEDGLPFLQGSAEFGEHVPTPVKWCSSPRKVAEVGDLLVSVRAPVGDTNFADQRIAVGRGLAIIRARSGAETAFLRLAIQNQTQSLLGKSGGGMFSSITGANLRGFEIPLPPLPVQRRIVDLMAHLDNQIANLRLERDAARWLWESLLPKRLAGSADALLGSHLSRIDAGKSPSGEERLPDQNERAVLKVSAIGRNQFNPSEVKTVGHGVLLPLDTSLRAGDVLMVRANGVLDRVGQVCQVPKDYPTLYLCDKTLRLVPTPNLDSGFMACVLLSDDCRRQIRELTGGSDMRNISQKAIREIRIPSVPMEIQKKIAGDVRSAANLAARLTSEIESMEGLRLQVLSSLLTGIEQIPDNYDLLLDGVA